MPASAQISLIEAPWKPERTKQRSAASRIAALRSVRCTVSIRGMETGVLGAGSS